MSRKIVAGATMLFDVYGSTGEEMMLMVRWLCNDETEHWGRLAETHASRIFGGSTHCHVLRVV